MLFGDMDPWGIEGLKPEAQTIAPRITVRRRKRSDATVGSRAKMCFQRAGA